LHHLTTETNLTGSDKRKNHNKHIKNLMRDVNVTHQLSNISL